MRMIVIVATCLACFFALVYLACDTSATSISARRLQSLLDKPTMAFVPAVLPTLFAPIRGRQARNPTVTFESRTLGVDPAEDHKDWETRRQEAGYDRRVKAPASKQRILPTMQQATVIERPRVASSQDRKQIEDFRSKLERQFEAPSPPPPPPARGDGGNGGDDEDDIVTMKQLSASEAKYILDAWIEDAEYRQTMFHSVRTEAHQAALQELETVRSFVEDLPEPCGPLNSHLSSPSTVTLPVWTDSQKIMVAMYAGKRTWFGGPVLALAAGAEPGFLRSSDVLEIKHVLVSPFLRNPKDLVASQKMRSALRSVTEQLGLNLKLPEVDGV